MTDAIKSLANFTLRIERASFDKKTGEMRWRAVASDTDVDSFGDKMSLNLFKDFLLRAETEEAPPDGMCSDYWCGGMPYLSISHYPDLSGDGVPGELRSLYIDGTYLKAKGVFSDDDLGRAAFKSVCDDLYSENSAHDDPVRISIAFLDYGHGHGNGNVFMRDSIFDVCPDCEKATSREDVDREFLKGHLIHLALTRVPVNTRTSMEVDRSMGNKPITRKQDAASIVGEEQAEKLEESNELIGKSEALVIKSDEDVEEVVAEVEEEAVEEVVEDTEKKSETVDPEVATADAPVSDVEPVVEKAGATSLVDYFATEQAMEEMNRISDLYYALSDVLWNIFYSDGVEDKKSAISRAIGEFNDMLTAKAVVQFSAFVEKGETGEKDLFDNAFSAFKTEFEILRDSDATSEEKLRALQTPYEQFSQTFIQNIDGETIEVEQENTDTQVDLVNALSKALADAMQPVGQKLDLLLQSSKSSAPETPNKVPVRRSLQAPQPLQTQVSNKPRTIKEVIRASVGL